MRSKPDPVTVSGDALIGLYGDMLSEAWQRVGMSLGSQAHPIDVYHGRELEFVKQILGARTWRAQDSMLTRLLEHKRVTVRGCRKATKTHGAAIVFEAMMQCAPTIAITTAPSNLQVESLLWAKIASLHHRASLPLRGELHATSLKIGSEHYGLGFATNMRDRFQGFHAGVEIPEDPNAPPPLDVDVDAIARVAHDVLKRSSTVRLLFIVDEAAGVDQMIFDALRGSMLGENVYVLLLANPTISAHDLHDYARSHQPGSRYWRIKIGARTEAAPEGIERVADSIQADEVFEVPYWAATARALEAEYPPDSPFYRPYVLAQFMDESFSNRVVTWEMLRGAAEPKETNLKRGAHVGFDTAAEGDDANVAALYVDSVKVSVDQWHSGDTIKTWERMKMLRTHWQTQLGVEIPWKHVHIDDAPIAKGIIDVARREGCYLDCVKFGGAPTLAMQSITGRVEYINRRAELYWVMRELLRTGRACIPEKYAASWRELSSHEYSIDGRGRLLIEPKDKVKARLGKSPDHADADVLAFATAPRIAMYRM